MPPGRSVVEATVPLATVPPAPRLRAAPTLARAGPAAPQCSVWKASLEMRQSPERAQAVGGAALGFAEIQSYADQYSLE